MTALSLDDGLIGDGMIVEALRRGNGAAMSGLVTEYRDAMLRTARNYVADPGTGEDVVQDTWLAVLRGIDGFDGRSSLRTWIFAILTNRAKTTGQRNGRVVPISSLGGPRRDQVTVDQVDYVDRHRHAAIARAAVFVATPEEAAVTSDDVRVVLDVIVSLPPLQRQVIRLRDVEGWSASDVCAALGLTAGNQRVLLHRARVQVRRQLGVVDGPADDHMCNGSHPSRDHTP